MATPRRSSTSIQDIAGEIESKIYEALGLSRDLVKPIESRDRQSNGQSDNGADSEWPAMEAVEAVEVVGGRAA